MTSFQRLLRHLGRFPIRRLIYNGPRNRLAVRVDPAAYLTFHTLDAQYWAGDTTP